MNVARRTGPVQLAGRLIVGAFVGKLLGFAREIEMARLLGASYIADSFRAGMTGILLPITVLQGDIVPSVMIPLHRQWTAEGIAPLRFTLLTIIFLLITLPVMLVSLIFANQWVGILVAGFGPEAHALTVRFVQVMSLAMPGVVLVSCFSCVEVSVGRSRITTIRASIQNFAVMGGIGLMALTGNPMLIGWAFTASMTLVSLYGGIMLARERELTLKGASFGATWDVAREFGGRVRVLLVTPFADQANTLLERTLVSDVGVGAVASMEYARTLTETAFYLISQPIGFVVLAQKIGDRETTRTKAEAILRPLMALSLPAVLFIMVFSTDIVTVVLRRGAFQDQAVALTSAALSGIAVGLWAITIGMVFIRMLNAAGRNRTAAFVMLCGAAGQAVVNLFAVPHLGVMGAGFGDSTRGIFILIGTAYALHSGRLLLRLLFLMAAPSIGFVAMGVAIRQIVALPTLRLVLGSGTFGIGIILCFCLLAPDVVRTVVQRLRPRRVRAEL